MYYDAINNEYYDDNFIVIVKYSGISDIVSKIDSHDEFTIIFSMIEYSAVYNTCFTIQVIINGQQIVIIWRILIFQKESPW